MTRSPTAGSQLKRTVFEFVRNLAVTFSLPFVDVARCLGAVNPPRPVAPKLRAISENPAGRSLSALVVRGVRRLMGDPLGSPSPILKDLARIAENGQPIVIGPWLSEVGFEVLYWIPFLQWAVRQHSIPSSRILVVSRGGAEPWYRHLGGRYIDILDHFTAAEFRELNERRIAVSGHQKHMEMGEVDRIILDRVCAAAGLAGRYEVLHPSLMYQLFLPIWQRRAPSKLVLAHTLYLPMSQPDSMTKPPGLPASYTAAKFYFSDAFPHTDDNVSKIRRLLRAYLLEGPVVLLTSGIQIDDHIDFLEGLPEGVTVVRPSEPARNLLMQTTIVAGAKRFVGTYGGFSYLAPMLGVPSLCVYSDLGRLMPMHLDVAFRVFRQFICGDAERGCASTSRGVLPTARFSPIHIDSLNDILPVSGKSLETA